MHVFINIVFLILDIVVIEEYSLTFFDRATESLLYYTENSLIDYNVSSLVILTALKVSSK